jgi:hypothetical protein
MGKLLFRFDLLFFSMLLLFVGIARPAGAQITSASLVGWVRDSQGAAIPGATVTLTSNTRGTTTEMVTTADGDFVFPTVQADTYSLKVALPGLKSGADNMSRFPPATRCSHLR